MSLKRIILIRGGGFKDLTKEGLFCMVAKVKGMMQGGATTHPCWDTWAKITLDSATMMNKGLES